MRFNEDDKEGRAYYKGQLKAGRFHGKGTMRWSNGTEYIGEWRKGRMEGEGRLFIRSKTTEGHVEKTYGGRWIQGQLHGHGYIKYSANDPLGRDCFTGAFFRGGIEGKGEMRWRNGVKYCGIWDQGRRLVWSDEGADGDCTSCIEWWKNKAAACHRDQTDGERAEELMLDVEEMDNEFSSLTLKRNSNPMN